MALELRQVYLDALAQFLEAAAVLAIVAGALFAVWSALRSMLQRRDGKQIFDQFRTHLAKSILIGVEFLIASDIVGTVTIDPTPESLGKLAMIVLIRTFLSFTLEVEIEGRWPWQRNRKRDE
ncbi:MAG: DUF1622 domain-containing protein [Pseudotabrizicola sp.]|uniref:DUF1622 domain-containing protein n=1 Tax=Pseudotabrizicola sp. TaxID=2939647 RepID=UPI00271E2B33|nr:DUF1622 domain-containing protein [Pseudotabrizicola sp.]MDO9638416.1 DUF1622 domain-containing protein [Pseudotabrizicola sp.]